MLDPQEPRAAITVALDLVRHRWTPETLRALAQGPLRFRDLMAHLAAPGKVVYTKSLVAALRHLEAHGLITHDLNDDQPPNAVYAITDLGNELWEHLQTLQRFIGEHWPELHPDNDADEPDPA